MLEMSERGTRATVKKGKLDLRKKVMPTVIVRQRKPWRRKDGVFMYFEDNAGAIVNPKGEMKRSATTGPIGKECADLWSYGSVLLIFGVVLIFEEEEGEYRTLWARSSEERGIVTCPLIEKAAASQGDVTLDKGKAALCHVGLYNGVSYQSGIYVPQIANSAITSKFHVFLSALMTTVPKEAFDKYGNVVEGIIIMDRETR
ncbi:50S/60S RIBOSOMAL PROTEIN L14/L23 [Salix viminalis]|uniref:50S/60S RIBOSOMAL PROTEIN L14/L23 n=1 Tax=Salix viminalis TaxID=40686 RepID=A0A9Q0NVQ9_SALVM|nr:50S/60S RIBOSOMAL PROTEIN L14/L23 [Salix viminalis]